MRDVLHSPDHLSIDEISSPITSQIFDFCDPQLFPETLQATDIDDITTAPTPTTNAVNLSVIFDPAEDLENDISASITFSPSPTSFSVPPFLAAPPDQIDFSSLQPQLQVGPTALPSVFDEECLGSVPSFLCNPMGSFLPGNLGDGSGIYGGGSVIMGAEMHQDLDYKGESGGMYCQETMQRVFNAGELQALSNESQQLVSAPLASEMSSLEEPAFKVGKLSVEQRKEKIHRYMKKRNERNFSKKIKYACRKTLADSRPRVRGRFAKNDDFGETHRPACSNHEEDDDEEVVVKEEDDMVDSSDIFAHISGVNSFKCNYPIQSWI